MLRELADFYEAYTKLKRKWNVVNFHDAVELANQLLRRQKSVATAVTDRYRYILVDEFQVK